MTDSTQTSSYLIKILSGPHQGAEVAVGEGELIIGSSLESDLILSDTLIAPSHLKLHIEKGEIAITPLADKVYLDGYLIAPEAKLIHTFQYITLGSTHLVIGPNGEAWPTLSPPNLSELKNQIKEGSSPTVTPLEANKPASEDTPQEEPSSEKDPEVSSPPQEGEDKPADDAKQPASKKTKELTKPKTGSRVPILIPVIGGFLLLIALLIGGFLFLYSSSEPKVNFNAISLKQFEKGKQSIIAILESRNIASEDFQFEYKNRQLEFTGMVDTNRQKRDLERAIRTLNPYYKINIRSQESLVITCREVLNLLNATAVVSGQGVGVVKISGYLANTSVWENAKKSLLSDTPGLVSIIDKVVTAKEVADYTFPILNRYQIGQRVKLYAESQGVVARGSLTESSRKDWYEARLEIEKALGPEIAFKDEVEFNSGAEKIYLDARIESVTITESLKWISLQNGKTYFEGSIIPSGYTIERISKEGVVIKKARDRITLKIGEQ
jgi:type III secretion system YscD/HrpQ family protein